MSFIGEENPLPMMLDGAMITALMSSGMPADFENNPPEVWAMENKNVVSELQKRYLLSGCNIIYTPTFCSNRAALKRYGLSKRTREFNLELGKLSVEVASQYNASLTPKGRKALVAGDISMSGLMPADEVPTKEIFDEMVDVFAEQAEYLKAAGVDLLVCETFTTLTEARAALIGARRTGLPVMVTLTLVEAGKALSGWDLPSAVVTLQSLGAVAVGLNCSAGPESIVAEIKAALPYAKIPLIAKPCATYNGAELSPVAFAEHMRPLMNAGAVLVGGCCGTQPEHLAVLRGVLESEPIIVPDLIEDKAVAVEGRAFIISTEQTLSEPIICDSELEESLIESEEEGNTALVEIKCEGDIENLIEAGHMSDLPIMISTYDAILLDEVLKRFPGRLLVDYLCEIEDDLLEEITEFYGAILS